MSWTNVRSGGNGERGVGAFSLLEVVVAIGVFALGVIVVIGLFAPVTRSVTVQADAESAARLGDAIQLELVRRVREAGSWAPVVALLQETDDAPLDADADSRLLFANRAGTRIGEWQMTGWTAPDERFFEIALFRNTELSPTAADDVATVLVYTVRLRWPAGAGGEHGHAPEVLFLPGALSR